MIKVKILRENLKLQSRNKIENNHEINIDFTEIELIPALKLLYQIYMNGDKKEN